MRRWWGALLLLAVLLAGCSTRAQRLYRRAETFFAQGKYELAAADYSKLYRQAPQDPLAPNALFKLAYLYREEFDDPHTAVALYQRVVDDYPESAFVDDALIWLVYVQGRQLQDPAGVLRACQRLDECLPDQKQVRASARLELARTYLQAGQVPYASRTLQEVIEHFGDQTESSAEAQYRLALLTRDQLSKPDEAFNMLEALIEKHPDTPAATKARQVLGFEYYTVKSREEKQRQQEMVALARVLTGIPPLPAEEHPSLQLLRGLQSLLAQAGAEVSLNELMTVTGLAFQIVVDWEHPRKLLYFSRNPLPLVAEAWGFGYNSWTFGSAREALPALGHSLLRNRPVLLLHGSASPRWCLFMGYRPQDKQVYLLRAGQGRPSVVSESDFEQGWSRQAGARIFTPMPASGYQFALTELAGPPGRASILRATVLRATLALDQVELLGAPTGRAGYEELTKMVRECATVQQPETVEQFARWSGRALPMLVRARQAAGGCLEAWAADFPEPRQLVVRQTASRYAQFAERWQSLSEALQAAAQAEGQTGTWISLGADLEALAADEQAALQNLASSLGG